MVEPLYRRVAHDLRERISKGEWGPGIQLPSEPELEKRYGYLADRTGQDTRLSRNTVRLALAALANEGLIEARQGRGTFVRERTSFTVLASSEEGGSGERDLDAFVAAVTESGRRPQQVDLRTEFRTASAEVAERLQIDEGDEVVVRGLKRLIDGKPWSIQNSFYPGAIAQGTLLMSPRNIEHGTIAELGRHGHVQVGYRDEVVCRMPRLEEAAFLGVGAGIPVLEMFRTAYSAEQPIRLTINVYAGDSTQLAYEIGNVDAREGEGIPDA
ncbi:GntR family transcriptional regulator [Planotetraspora phitsanulokensis]|uniref:GntR family transcriptional regulator n=1 Tax=Planotetraspora phitsanulokensis TaxID=575192 RepID=A0A8J3XE05_9ACTN|nr:GntR family transcriptional regulator [Planotetraspora phitsanulokensis]GII37204.1 GntR family transcriptional regulator [Planotetraspora phitsanulokensis]